MALDGAFLHHLEQEIETAALGSRVDKIYQPNREELLLSLRSREGARRLLLSARANSARICLIDSAPENPKAPPMFCMLLRKRLAGAKLVQLHQPGLERVLRLVFDAKNELGDPVQLSLVMEIMGRYSNVVFVDEQGKIIDALKRVDAEMSSERLVLPGLRYRLPPPQDKLDPAQVQPQAILQKMRDLPADLPLDKALLRTLQGVSPVVCRELQFLTGQGADVTAQQLTWTQASRLITALEKMQETILQASGKPFLALGEKKPLDFSFMPIRQYGDAATLVQKDSFSALLEAFFGTRDSADRMRVKSQDLLRVLTNATERLSRKINNQRGELAQCAKRNELRMYGDLLSANLYRLEKGAAFAELPNFYEQGEPLCKITLDPALTPNENAQHYYKRYRKASTAYKVLQEQIANAEQELAYLDTVFDELSRAGTEQDLNDIRAELTQEGYLRKSSAKHAKERPAAPFTFRTSEGFRVLVGRNNRQNDELTLRKARREDLWFHTKNIPGSHVILETEGRAPGEGSIAQAAGFAAYFSHARDSSQVPVDYTLVRCVSKPQGAKPGMVIYVNQKTLFVTPDASFVEAHKADQ